MSSTSLSKTEIERYGRQVILKDFELGGQVKLKNTAVLIVGVGGLGSPLALSLAAAGIGRIGLVDYDCVEISNLHRQILHTESSIGLSKVGSAEIALKGYYHFPDPSHNSACSIVTFNTWISTENVLGIMSSFDIICDTSDNVATRYLLNSACIHMGRPLISASCLGWEGQIMTFDFSTKNEFPCYQCIFPVPPSPNFTMNCSDGGILGPVTSIIGSLQALEVINLCRGLPNYLQKMFFYDGKTATFRTIPLRRKLNGCRCCSSGSLFPPHSIKEAYLLSPKCPSLLANSHCHEIDVHELDKANSTTYTLIDVRLPHHFIICALKNSTNIPINVILKLNSVEELHRLINEHSISDVDTRSTRRLFFICRRGVDSLIAVHHILKLDGTTSAYNVTGGLIAWAQEVDSTFPIY